MSLKSVNKEKITNPGLAKLCIILITPGPNEFGKQRFYCTLHIKFYKHFLSKTKYTTQNLIAMGQIKKNNTKKNNKINNTFIKPEFVVRFA